MEDNQIENKVYYFTSVSQDQLSKNLNKNDSQTRIITRIINKAINIIDNVFSKSKKTLICNNSNQEGTLISGFYGKESLKTKNKIN